MEEKKFLDKQEREEGQTFWQETFVVKHNHLAKVVIRIFLMDAEVKSLVLAPEMMEEDHQMEEMTAVMTKMMVKITMLEAMAGDLQVHGGLIEAELPVT